VVVIARVRDRPDVERVLTGPDGVLSAIQKNAIVIDMSSISPVATERLAKAVAEKGASMLDAPVSGGEIGAINAALSIMVGGGEAAFTRAKPILEKMGNGEKIIHIGKSGAGQVCKVCNQVAIGGALSGVSEAIALAKKAGVDAGKVRQALLGGFAASRGLEGHGERMLTGNYKPGFRAKLYQKDLRLADEGAAADAVAGPATADLTQLGNHALAGGGRQPRSRAPWNGGQQDEWRIALSRGLILAAAFSAISAIYGAPPPAKHCGELLSDADAAKATGFTGVKLMQEATPRPETLRCGYGGGK